MKKKDIFSGVAFTMPALAIYTVFTILPLLGTFYFAFTSWDGINKPIFTGLYNFLDVFTEKSLKISLMNSFIFALINLIIGNPLCLLLALAYEKISKGKRFFQTVFYIPAVISQVVMSMVWADIFQYEGVLNSILKMLGLNFLVVDWFGSENIVKITVSLVIMWAGTGFGALIYYAGLKSISDEVLESATIDGAEGLKKLVFVKLPLIMPTITINVFIGLVSSFKIFDVPFLLTHGGPGDASSTMGIIIYKYAFEFERYGQSAALGVLFLFIVTLISFMQVSYTRKKEIEV